MSKRFIYFKGVRNVECGKICVADGQKTYYDPIGNVSVPYGSASQTKRQIMEKACSDMELSVVNYEYTVDKNGVPKQAQSITQNNPIFVDLLLGGYMTTKNKEDESKNETLKRTSPLNISAFVPTSSKLVTLSRKLMGTSSKDDKRTNVVLKFNNNQVIDGEEAKQWLDDNNRKKTTFTFYDEMFSGLFKYEVAIDKETLFSVSINGYEKEISDATKEQMIAEGWELGTNSYGDCLIAPKAVREIVAKKLARAIVEWEHNSNQSTHYSMATTTICSVSYSPRQCANSIYVTTDDDNKSRLVADIDYNENIFVEKSAKNLVDCDDSVVSAMAMERAIDMIESMILDYQY